MRILVAIDESVHAEKVLTYVGSLLRETRNVKVTLFHVLKPMPRQYLEHGGSENPAVEGQLSDQLRNDQAEWYRKERETECPILTKASEALQKAGFPVELVSLKFGYEDNVARNILEEAKEGGYDTIVLGRHGLNGKRRMFGGGIAEHLLRDAAGVTVWVVD